MENLTIGRFENDPQAQGFVEPASKKWQLIIDKEGYPHLLLKVKIEGEKEGEIIDGMFALDHMIDISIKEIMDGGVFGGKLSPEEEAEAYKEYIENQEKNLIPCPRVTT